MRNGLEKLAAQNRIPVTAGDFGSSFNCCWATLVRMELLCLCSLDCSYHWKQLLWLRVSPAMFGSFIAADIDLARFSSSLECLHSWLTPIRYMPRVFWLRIASLEACLQQCFHSLATQVSCAVGSRAMYTNDSLRSVYNNLGYRWATFIFAMVTSALAPFP